MFDAIALYHKYYRDKNYEQMDLFRLLAKEFKLKTALYPGCFVQISPSFVLPYVVYIDSDKQAKKFFLAPQVKAFIEAHKSYAESARFKFYGQDYRQAIAETEQSFDLLISQYAGFISEPCKTYLKLGGLLLVNNSHGDAGVAALDPDYELLAVIQKNRQKYRLSKNHLEEYFIPKKPIHPSREYIHSLGKGLGYTKTAPLYLFRRLS